MYFLKIVLLRKNEVRDKAVQIKKKEFFGSELFQFFLKFVLYTIKIWNYLVFRSG